MATVAWSVDESNHLDDDALVREVLSGDRELFGTIVSRYYQRLYRLALSVVRNCCDAEDVVQDTFLSALQHLHQYSGQGRLINWLSRITMNNSLACIASRHRELQVIDDGEQPITVHLADITANPEQDVLAAQSSEILGQAIRALPDHHRRVIALRDLHECDTKTAAKCLGISEENVKTRLHRGRRSLRAILMRTGRSYALLH